MQPLDWIILSTVLLFIVGYGVYKTRNIKSADGFLAGSRNTPWWAVGLSIMATQASAITFLSTPGQAYDDGMRFVQFYIGLPIAMVLLAVFVLPKFMKLKVYTAYEFLENRFDIKTRQLTAILFLLQRGMAAGITIFAPAIILSTLLSWNLTLTNVLIGTLVIIYTLAGGTEAVSQTQKQQMFIIMGGMIAAFVVLLNKLPSHISPGDAMHLSGQLGKLNAIDFKFSWDEKYNIWTGIFGGTFLFLSYFGTDQSQVQRYLGGKSIAQSKMGLMFNGLFKLPMQFFILLVGILVFVFYQFNYAPLHFNTNAQQEVLAGPYKKEYSELQEKHQALFNEKLEVLKDWHDAADPDNKLAQKPHLQKLNHLHSREKNLRDQASVLIEKTNPTLETNDKDFVFLTFVLNHMPTGLIGLLLAVIFSAAMSSTSSELNALATTTVVDIYKRSFRPQLTDRAFLNSSRAFTLMWGILAILFAISASLFENLIQAVNILGSIFYGTVLGVFVIAFFLKKISGSATFIGAIISQIIIIMLFGMNELEWINLPYLWLNAIGCLLVMGISGVIQMGSSKSG